MNNYTSVWLPSDKLVITRLGGLSNLTQIKTWENSIVETLSLIPDNSDFKILVDLHSFKADNFDTHKYYRNIIPAALALYGWRIGYLSLFEEANDLLIKNIRGITCKAAAHVHHDTSKIDKYQSMFGHDREQYFTDPVKGRHWIEQLNI